MSNSEAQNDGKSAKCLGRCHIGAECNRRQESDSHDSIFTKVSSILLWLVIAASAPAIASPTGTWGGLNPLPSEQLDTDIAELAEEMVLAGHAVTAQACSELPSSMLLAFNDVPVNFAINPADHAAVTQRMTDYEFVPPSHELILLTGLVTLVCLLSAFIFKSMFVRAVAFVALGASVVVLVGVGGPVRILDHAQKIADQDPKGAIKLIRPWVEPLDHRWPTKLLNRLGIYNNPAREFVDTAIRHGIKTHLAAGNWKSAASLAVSVGNSPATESLRESTVGYAVKLSLQAGLLESAHRFALQAHSVKQSKSTRHTLDSIRAHYAIRFAEIGDLNRADYSLNHIASDFSKPLLGEAFAVVARARLVQALSTGKDERSLKVAAEILRNYAEKAQNHKTSLALRLKCDVGEIAAVAGHLALEFGNPNGAIRLLEATDALVHGDEIAQTFLPLAYWHRGSARFETKQYKAAVVDLNRALTGLPKESALLCDTATANILHGFTQVDGGQGNPAKQSAQAALSLCPSDNVRAGANAIVLAAAEQALHKGDYLSAQRDFQQIRFFPNAEDRALAKGHLDAIAHAPALIRKLNKLTRWSSLPKWTGIGCAEVDSNLGTCQQLAIFRDQTIIGLAPIDSSEVHFDAGASSDGYSTFAMELDQNVGFDVLQKDQGDLSFVYFESDSDSRLDIERHYVGGILRKEIKHSGKIRVRVIGAAIQLKGTDIWDGPDSYLGYSVNGQTRGFSDVYHNSYWPSHQGYALYYHHKHGDVLRIWMNDWDAISDHEYIDGWEFSGSLPQSAEYYGDRRNAVIELEIKPTKLMSGFRRVEEEELANTFKAASRATETGVIGDVIRGANEAHAETKTMSMIASILGPEAIVLGFARRASIAAQFGTSLLSYVFIDEAVTAAEDRD